MHFIVVGSRSLMNAIVNGDPLWPAVTFFLLSFPLAIVAAVVRARRRPE
ncbi:MULTISPECIES: hypothetical protein [Kitasatospora]|uniref:ABC transporter permease n=1 Tax=Kitasatospora cathayae TaxID=3004092 RepID=A0ABY7Q1G5_9ACTN|nr:hypothetical protein [Kitasatospora sp. HUAS 3-15]WBP86553.1 hypothetical protein O1G21_12340 [Kitasatospora sp. HUAS 3-15]